MRCLYCGKELALFKRLRGGEFCSDAHRQRYQEEYTQLALNRLLHAQPSQERDSTAAKPQELKLAEPESPALKRRERLGREDAPAGLPALSTPLSPASASIAAPFGIEEKRVESAARLGALNQTLGALNQALGALNQAETPQPTAVLDREPAPAAVPVAAAGERTSPVEEPAPADMSTFLVEYPVPTVVEAAGIAVAAANLKPTPGLALPRLQELPREATARRLDPAGRIALAVCTPTDFPTPPRERGLELREFVRGVPQVEIRVRPAVETGFEPAREALEVRFVVCPPEGSPRLWQAFGGQASEEELSVLGCQAEILLGDLARLDFAASGWEEAGESGASVEQPAPASEIPAAIGSARLEPMRVEPLQLDPASRESSRMLEELAPLRFAPVHLDPVFMEQIAATAEFNALKTAQGRLGPPQNDAAVRETLADEPVAPETVEAAGPATSTPIAPATATPAASAPPTITKPVPVTLHGLAPARGKPVQVFTAAVSRSKDVQVPRETGLPLRPIMVLGPAPTLTKTLTNMSTSVPSSVPLGTDEKAAASKPVKSIPVPEKRDQRPTEIKPRRSEVRILPAQVKEEAPQRQKEAASHAEPAKLEQGRPEPVQLEPTGKPELLKDPPAAASKEMAPKEASAERPKPAPQPVEIRPAAPVPAEAKPRVAPLPQPAPPPKPAIPEEPDLLGLPKLSFQHSENFWTRLPLLVRAGALAAILALIVGGAILTSRGSGASKTPAPASNEPQWVETGSALANTAGWMQDWFADRTDARQQGRHVDVLRGSLTLRDYRLVFEGQIEQGALGWVFRANDKSFYVEKIQVVTPGLQPVMALVHFAVINGQEQPRTQVPLPIQAHLDTTYKVRMDAVGNRFTTWVQDQKVDQWTDSQIDAGGVGLYYDSGDSAKLRDTLNVIPLRQK
jgi:hypothetical protein